MSSRRLGALAVFAISLALLFLLRGEVLQTPYFWDEVGYYIPNAVSMYRNNLYPIPDTAVPQSYPPLQPLTIVFGWWIFGFSIAATRITVFLTTAAVLTVTYLLGERVTGSRAAGASAAALTLALPVFLGQTGFAQPEMLLALFTTAATLWLFERRMVPHAIAVACLLMTKWTAIVSLPVFGLYLLATARTWREGLLRQLWYAPALGALAAWLGFFYAKTGTLTSTDSYYARVNLWDNLNAEALVFRWAVRVEQLAETDLAYLVTGPILVAGAIWLARRSRERAAADSWLSRPDFAIYAVLAGQCLAYLAFLTISGFLLPRYFVPVWPLFTVMGAAAIYRLMPLPLATGYTAAAALLMHLCWYGWFPPFHPALLDARPEYMRMIDTHVAASRYLEERYPDARVAAPWPVVDELSKPYLGYVSSPLRAVTLKSLPDGEAALDEFDLLYESPVPQNPNPARELALRLGLVEVATFTSGRQSVTLWVKK